MRELLRVLLYILNICPSLYIMNGWFWCVSVNVPEPVYMFLCLHVSVSVLFVLLLLLCLVRAVGMCVVYDYVHPNAENELYASPSFVTVY